MNFSSVNRFLSTLNVVLLFAGYELFSGIVSVILGNLDSPLVMNIGYRGVSVVVCLLVIFQNLGIHYNKYNQRCITLLYIFWSLLILRFVYDMYFRPDVSVLPAICTKTWSYMVVLTIIPMISVSLSIKQIDFKQAFKWITILFSVAVLIAFFRNYYYDTDDIEELSRISLAGLSSIGSGQLALTAIILSSCYLLNEWKKQHSVLTLLLFAIIAIVGTIVMLRTGSRGPLLALVGVGGMLAIAKTNRPMIWIIFLIVFVLFFNQIVDLLLHGINVIAPNLYSRFMSKAESGGQFENRMFYYNSAIDAFRDNPIIGKQFAIYLPEREMIYSHNILLDSIMQLGIIGGSLMLVIIIETLRLSYRLIRSSSCVTWICLLFVQQLFYLMLSSSFYLTPLFSIIIVLLFKWDSIGKDTQSLYS